MRPILLLLSLTLLFACNYNAKNAKADTTNSPYPSYVNDLLKEIDRYPDSSELRVQVIDTMDSLFLFNEALVQIDSFIAREPNNYGVWFRKGELAIRIADTAVAIQSFSTAAKIYSNPDVLLTLANLYAAQKNKLALELCNTVIEQKPDRTYIAHSYYVIGLYHENTGNTATAIENFNTCIKKNYNYLDAYLEIGWIYFDQQKMDQAKSIFETAIEVKPTEATPHYWLGKCFEKMGKKLEAISAYETAAKLDKSLTEATEAISRIKAAKK